MLARFTSASELVRSVWLDRVSTSETNFTTIQIDTQNLQFLMSSGSSTLWAFCAEQATPVYRTLNTINHDVEHVAQLLSQLEPISARDDEVESLEMTAHAPIILHPKCHQGRVQFYSSKPFRRKRRRSNPPLHPGRTLIYPSTHPSTPTIIITPSSTCGLNSNNHVPYQDGAFGQHLTVPCHPTFNQIFPPLVAPGKIPRVERWKWTQGHWEAIVPGLEDQLKRGLFSTSTTLSRRKRAFRRHNSSKNI